jgi:hypothetical protein
MIDIYERLRMAARAERALSVRDVVEAADEIGRLRLLAKLFANSVCTGQRYEGLICQAKDFLTSEAAITTGQTAGKSDETQERRCPIENPYACLGARCQIFGVCDHNRRLDRRPLRYADDAPVITTGKQDG